MNALHDNSTHQIFINMAEAKVSAHLAEELVIRTLFSCIAVVLYDPKMKIGGLLHCLLPHSSLDLAKAKVTPCLFVDTGIAYLVQTACDLGAEKERMQFKCIGGADIPMPNSLLNIGERNCKAVRDYFAHEKRDLRSWVTGGSLGRSLRLKISTGEVVVATSEEERIIL